ncbi:NADP-dependent oxidoreductase domain-containing protein [Mycena floridula]|nr:NADP-dependent oxidoreductase domain-containing protein [Mycena floridula]KAJ7582400.1 NADP-dependent oxidoreductase domain-containing protein [Mycena floridula]
MSLFALPSPPESKLGRYRVLSPSAAVRVSPLALGAMSIGDKWAEFGMGSMDKDGSFKLMDAFFEAGGNFIDTANNYQDGSSEEFVGEWAEARGVRDQLVIATKYSTGYQRGKSSIPVKSIYAGNNVKSMHLSVEASLKKLRTTYIDILYVHWWDYTTSVEEVMNGLHALVSQGKVLYLGISDTPAWIVSKANQYARDHGRTPFCIYQGKWNVMERDFEREIIPMARSEGLALAPWSVLAAGKIRTDEEEQRRKESGEKGRALGGSDWERTDAQKKVCKVLEEVAAEVRAKHITAVAIAYVMHRTPYVFPIIGGRKVEHLLANLEALDISLSLDQMKRIETATPFDIGFPHNMVGTGEEDCFLMASTGTFDRLPLQPVVTPAKK